MDDEVLFKDGDFLLVKVCRQYSPAFYLCIYHKCSEADRQGYERKHKIRNPGWHHKEGTLADCGPEGFCYLCRKQAPENLRILYKLTAAGLYENTI